MSVRVCSNGYEIEPDPGWPETEWQPAEWQATEWRANEDAPPWIEAESPEAGSRPVVYFPVKPRIAQSIAQHSAQRAVMPVRRKAPPKPSTKPHLRLVPREDELSVGPHLPRVVPLIEDDEFDLVSATLFYLECGEALAEFIERTAMPSDALHYERDVQDVFERLVRAIRGARRRVHQAQLVWIAGGTTGSERG